MEDESQSKPRRINTELIVALSAIFVSVITLFVYIYQASIMQEQQYASVWPYLEWDMTIHSQDGFYLSISNKGIGPAIIRSTSLTLDEKEMVGSIEYLGALLGDLDSVNLFHQSIDNRVLAPGETIEAFHVYSDVRTRLAKVYARTNYEICFCSVYGDCWVSKKFFKVEESECSLDVQ